MKDGYPKLTLFKVWILFFKSVEKLEVISEFLPKNYKNFQRFILTNFFSFSKQMRGILKFLTAFNKKF